MRPKTKILATLGPASSGPAVLEALLRAGMGSARLNMSHGTHDEHARRVDALRDACKATGKACAVLVDLSGPKIRTGPLPGGTPLTLRRGDRLVLVSAGYETGPDEIPTTYADLHKDVKPGETLLLSDGWIRLTAENAGTGKVVARVEEGGRLAERQGINLPGTDLSTPALTEKDRVDLAFGVSLGADYVALSFVRKPEDVRACREASVRLGSKAPIIAKIEKPEAVSNLEGVLAESDGLMVARGDLAVEVSTSAVPILQKEIIRMANLRKKLVVTATQMLESMTSRRLPTRAEAADVANAVLDGTDAVMLSAETAVGKHPAVVVETMASILLAAERSRFFSGREATPYSEEDDSESLSIAHAAFTACREYHAEAVVVFTESGATARVLSKFKPDVPLIAMTPLEETARRLSLVWGAVPVLTRFESSLSDTIRNAEKSLLESGLLGAGAKVVLTAGAVTAAGGTDMLKVGRLGGLAEATSKTRGGRRDGNASLS